MSRSCTSQDEKPEELLARGLLEREFGDVLMRVGCPGQPTVDYRSADERTAIEVKRVTDEMHLSVNAAETKERTTFDSALLTRRWLIVLDLPTLSTTLVPMPMFPDDDGEKIAHWREQGFHVMRKSESEAQWLSNHPGPYAQAPRLKGLVHDIETHLAVLEQHNMTTTRGLSPFSGPSAVGHAVRAIGRRTRGALCMSHEPSSMGSPGIDVLLASGYVRTDNGDTMVGRIHVWLSSTRSRNLLASLANEPEGTERHAVLVFDILTEPEHVAARAQLTSFCPKTSLELPDEIDVLWFILGPVACRYTAADGWTATQMPGT